ncbi:uncharacterized protein TM35_000041180 [Trypanosoma theileri]|uniref:Uncharacterized protein n=1 Tax=Trypanosoma theileri TaxID=67003 RepID=A0A1X0P4N3_9TRYP|nr:uncharacterized protein TM35_000041180 [Trypanosoma theileri]ORC91904.1 hypothetical protein TM35_000041180 [Trypanosoma theileri]
MTTMFVRLRHVMCLLVVLQCLSVLVLAQGETGVATEDANNNIGVAVLNKKKAWETYLDIPNFTKEDLEGDDFLGKPGNKELRNTVWNALVAVRESEVHFKNGTACMTEWKKVVEANEKTVRDAEDATKKIEGLTKSIGEVADRDVVDESGRKIPLRLKNTCEKKKFEDLLQEIPKVLGETKEKAPTAEAVFNIADANQTEVLCKATRSNVDDVLRNLEQKIGGIATFVGDYERSDKAMLVKRAAEGINATLRNVTALIDNVTVQDRFAVSKANAQVEEWRMAYAELAFLAELGNADTSETKGTCEVKGKEPQFGEIRKLLQTPKKEMDDAVKKVEAVGEDKKKKYAAEVNKRVTEAIKNMTTGMEREKERIAREKARREEGARRAAEEARRKREEEERARKETVQRAKENEAREAEKMAREKEAREAEKKAREKEVREAAEKIREEEAKRAAEKAKKKKDGSSSPALVHSSLILLVLSVLGCTLVC